MQNLQKIFPKYSIALGALFLLTVAYRRSLVRVSVPVWGIILSEPLDIVALVSRYLTN